MKEHEKEQEKKQIYQEWLGGASIKGLARKYHHWRYGIEDIVLEQARASVPASVHNQQVAEWQQATKCLRQELYHLMQACVRRGLPLPELEEAPTA